MPISFVSFILAASGGFLGAMVGGLLSFVMLGMLLLIGLGIVLAGGDGAFLDLIVWGPLFGPHVTFGGGAAALAYAYRRGYVDNGKDLGKPLLVLGKPDVLLVGSLFGLIGYLIAAFLPLIPWLGGNLDAIAGSIVISSIIARLAFGRTGLIGPDAEGRSGWARFQPTETQTWLPWMEKPLMVGLIGMFMGGLAAWITVFLSIAFPFAAAYVSTVGFAVSSFLLLFVALGVPLPVTHHMTLQGALVVALLVGNFPTLLDNPLLLIAIGALVGIFAALVGELLSRLFTIRGDTVMDPPTMANFVVSALLFMSMPHLWTWLPA